MRHPRSKVVSLIKILALTCWHSTSYIFTKQQTVDYIHVGKVITDLARRNLGEKLMRPTPTFFSEIHARSYIKQISIQKTADESMKSISILSTLHNRWRNWVSLCWVIAFLSSRFSLMWRVGCLQNVLRKITSICPSAFTNIRQRLSFLGCESFTAT